MIKRIKIKNFQRHKNLTIALGRITCITGNSDVGKSSVLRALRWVFLNVPKGSRFIRHGAKFAKVSIELDGHTIARIKGKRNVYILDGEIYKNPDKIGIPKPIQEIFKVSSLNFARQADLPLWFHDSAAQVGRELNRIINLEEIDRVMAKSAKLSKKAKASYTETKQRLKEAKQELEKLSHVPKLIKQVRMLQALAKKKEAGQERLETGMQLLHRVEETEAHVASLSAIRTKVVLDRLDKLARTIDGKQNKLDKLEELLEAIKDRKESIRCLIEQRNGSQTALRMTLRKIKTCPLCQQPLKTQS